ncbi:MAG: ADP-ribosylation factor-like protein, partial [Promethearchaeota archaeon]
MNMSNNKTSDKILLLGLAESGKTTILKVVTEGYKPEKKAGYTATHNYERKYTSLFGTSVTFFDLGGQVAFLDRFTGELASFIFSEVSAFIFVIDTIQVGDLSRAKYYFELALTKLKDFSPSALCYVL